MHRPVRCGAVRHQGSSQHEAAMVRVHAAENLPNERLSGRVPDHVPRERMLCQLVDLL